MAKKIAIITTDIKKVLIIRFFTGIPSVVGQRIFNRYNATELINQQEINAIKILDFFINCFFITCRNIN